MLQGPGIFITIKLDPYLQEFLRGYFKQNGNVFYWPKNHDLTRRFQSLLRPKSDNTCYSKPDYGDWAFRVDIPYSSEGRDPFIVNYLSRDHNKLLAKRIKEFADMVFHEEVISHRTSGWEYKDCVFIFMDDYHINQKHYDRLLKDFQRLRNNIRQKKFRKHKNFTLI